MLFSELMKSVSDVFNSWLNDETMQDFFNHDKESLQKEFIACIQNQIGSNFVVLTQEELLKKMNDYHNSIEGLEYFDGEFTTNKIKER